MRPSSDGGRHSSEDRMGVVKQARTSPPHPARRRAPSPTPRKSCSRPPDRNASSTSPQMYSPGCRRLSIVRASTSARLTPPPVTSALRYPSSPVHGSAHATSVSMSRTRSSRRSSASERAASTFANVNRTATRRSGSKRAQRPGHRSVPLRTQCRFPLGGAELRPLHREAQPPRTTRRANARRTCDTSSTAGPL